MLSETIKSERNKKGLSQKEFAKILGVSQQTIGSWEISRTSPDTEMIKKMAQFFGVTADYLIGNDSPPGYYLVKKKRPGHNYPGQFLFNIEPYAIRDHGHARLTRRVVVVHLPTNKYIGAQSSYNRNIYGQDPRPGPYALAAIIRKNKFSVCGIDAAPDYDIRPAAGPAEKVKSEAIRTITGEP